MSVTQLYDFGYKCSFTKDDVVVTSLDGKDHIFAGFRHEDVYLVDFATKEANLSTCLFSQSSLGWLWHRRLGHVGMKQLNRLLKLDLVVGLKNVKFKKISYVVHVKPESKLQMLIPPKVLCQPRNHWNYYIWIYLVLLHIEVLVGIAIVLW